MNEIEKAIIAIETAFEQENDTYLGCSFYLVIENALMTALEALREKQERDRGCEWCRQTGDAKPGEKKFLHATQYVVSGDGSVHYIKNSYCPNCGRKLEER